MQYIGPTIKYYYSKCFLLVNYVKCKACMANLSQISQFLLQFTGQLLVGFSSSLYGTAHFVLILFLAHGLSLSKQENKLQKQNQNTTTNLWYARSLIFIIVVFIRMYRSTDWEKNMFRTYLSAALRLVFAWSFFFIKIFLVIIRWRNKTLSIVCEQGCQ